MAAAVHESLTQIAREPHAVIVADRDGVIREWNTAAERILGYSAAEAIGQTVDLVMPEGERADHWHRYRHVMATDIINYGPDHILDVEGLRKNGSLVPLDVALEAIRDAAGHITGIVAVLREVIGQGGDR